LAVAPKMIALKFSRLGFATSLSKQRLRVTLGEEIIPLLMSRALYT
jgi:hypothetical protein